MFGTSSTFKCTFFLNFTFLYLHKQLATMMHSKLMIDNGIFFFN